LAGHFTKTDDRYPQDGTQSDIELNPSAEHVHVRKPDAPIQRHVPNWPRKPQKLRVIDAVEILVLLGDVALVLLSLAFSGALSSRCCRIYAYSKCADWAESEGRAEYFCSHWHGRLGGP
jgi:hypothetical protein